MSQSLMDTEVGGEQTQYESTHTTQDPHKKSGGQLGDAATTTDPSQTDAASEASAERGEQTAANIRYGQGISEQGMGGTTTGQTGEGGDEGYGRVKEQTESGDADGPDARTAEGYGPGNDVGA